VKSTVLCIGTAEPQMSGIVASASGFCEVIRCSFEHIRAHLAASRADLIVLVESGSAEALKHISEVRATLPGTPVILLISESTENVAIAALKAGICDYFKPPWYLPEVIQSIKNILRLNTGSTCAIANGSFIGESSWTVQLRSQLQRVASSDCNVLITGETGTGKELVAQAIHEGSRRSNKPLIAVNCAALPDTLLESELFGYERGAFTGAFATREGQIRAADGGTVFLDEIGEMSPYGQAKILRVIETRKVQRLGGKTALPVNIRIVAATNQDPERQIAANQFRKDLFFRLNVARIHLRPLRERREDIPCLLNHYVEYFNRHCGKAVAGITDEALAALISYDWPGNVRELKNLVEAVMVDCPVSRIDLADLPAHTLGGGGPAIDEHAERELLLAALHETKWNKSKAAGRLHWSRMTLYRKLVKYGITLEE
jgi:DNA-binding NtrC family response regulator